MSTTLESFITFTWQDAPTRLTLSGFLTLSRPSTSLKGINVEELDVLIADLPSPYRVLRPIPASLEKSDAGVIASFTVANINASGDDSNEAISNLKDLIVYLFAMLSALPPEQLGIGPKRQLATLQSFVAKDVNAEQTAR
jgi:hypothetical protein